MVNKCFFSNSVSQTKKIGAALVKEILGKKSKKAVILGLNGELGGGKTTFLQGFAKGLGIKEKILSPTFVIIRKFPIPTKVSLRRAAGGLESKFQTFYHIDCYRIEKPKEILDLGFKEIISGSQNIVAVEWADRIRKILPKDTLTLRFEFINKNKRKIVVKPKVRPLEKTKGQTPENNEKAFNNH